MRPPGNYHFTSRDHPDGILVQVYLLAPGRRPRLVFAGIYDSPDEAEAAAVAFAERGRVRRRPA